MASGRPQVTHWLGPNHSEWSPPTVIFLDTETETVEDDRRQTLALRLWVAATVDRRPDKRGRQRTEWGNGTTGDDLVAWVERQMVGRSTVWLYAHNLGFDAVTTRLPERMMRAGWELTQFSLADRAPWFRLRKAGKSLTMVDSWSWLPKALGTIGDGIGIAKPPLPDEDGPADEWWHRCAEDVRILAAAILELMAWWDREKLGHWTLSGAGCGWNAARHLTRAKSILVDPDPAGRRLDRQAIYGGRRDVTRHGTLPTGPFVQVDFVQAYPSIVANIGLPVKRFLIEDRIDPYDKRHAFKEYGAIAECVVTTDTPRYPCRIAGGVCYPTGTFSTTLCSPELLDARDRGQLVSVGRGQWHWRSKALAPWADWVTKVASGELADTPYVARVAAKAWGRSTIGKFAGHSSSVEDMGQAWWPAWHVEKSWDQERQVPAQVVDMGGRRWYVAQDLEADHAYPAIFAWVESETRVRLNQMLDAIGPGTWVQCDTDGIILDMAAAADWVRTAVQIGDQARDEVGVAAAICDHLAETTAPLLPRPKEAWETIEVIGPQQIIAGGSARLAGIRRDAERVADRTYEGWEWPKLAWQMNHGNASGFVRRQRRWVVPGVTAHRWVATTGEALPLVVEYDTERGNMIVPWGATPYPGMGYELAEAQWAGLKGRY